MINKSTRLVIFVMAIIFAFGPTTVSSIARAEATSTEEVVVSTSATDESTEKDPEGSTTSQNTSPTEETDTKGQDVKDTEDVVPVLEEDTPSESFMAATSMSVAAVTETDTCTIHAAANRTIFTISSSGTKLISNRPESENRHLISISASLPAGTYDVTLQSFDGYTGRENISPTGQSKEQWFAILKDTNGNEIVRTGTTTDLADNVAAAKQTNVVNTDLVVSSAMTTLVAYHAAGFGLSSSKPNSVVPVCAAFDLKTEDTDPTITITLNGSNPMEVTVGAPFTDPGATATTSDGSPTTLATTTDLNTSVIGSYTIIYTASSTTAGSASTTRTVNVISGPVNPPAATISISLNGPNPIDIAVGSTFNDPGVTATTSDGSAFTISSSTNPLGGVLTNATGTYTITYVASSTTAGSASTTRTVNVVPTSGTTTPYITITLNGENPLTITVGGTFTDPGATATTSDGSPFDISTSTDLNTGVIGSYTVIYTASSTTAGSASTTRTVNVVAATTPPGGGGGGGGGGGVTSGSGGSARPMTFSSIVLPISDATCPLLTKYLRFGYENDPVEVVKLQAFLNARDGATLAVTGFFDETTLAAVHAFQTRFLTEVMGPWDATRSSGYVYITTLKKINQIACETPFIISAPEQQIIDAYRANQAALEAGATTTPDGTPLTPPTIGSDEPIGFLPGIIGATSTFPNNQSNVAGAADSGVSMIDRLWGFVRELFQRRR